MRVICIKPGSGRDHSQGAGEEEGRVPSPESHQKTEIRKRRSLQRRLEKHGQRGKEKMTQAGCRRAKRKGVQGGLASWNIAERLSKGEAGKYQVWQLWGCGGQAQGSGQGCSTTGSRLRVASSSFSKPTPAGSDT